MTTPTQQERIELGQAKNQALSMITHSVKAEEDYKAWVKRFYKWNKEIEKEIFEEKEEAGKTTPKPSSNSQPQPSLNLPTGQIPLTQPSSKQKLCPKCNRAIPKTWQRHEACGWNMENVKSVKEVLR